MDTDQKKHLCESVVEKMDFLQPAEALPANGRGKRSMAKQARGRNRVGFGHEKPGNAVAVLTQLGSEV